jgi:ketosteroid isomerase-like protein
MPFARFGLAGLACGRISMTTRCVVETGDTALLSNAWTIEADGTPLSSVTAEVARRQVDGSWLYVIDTPYAGTTDDA